MQLNRKLNKLQDIIRSAKNMAVAFSGGVDSTFLLKTAHDILGDRVMAITVRASTYPEREFQSTVDFAASAGIKHLVVLVEEREIEGFIDNPANRCYLCKKETFRKILIMAKQNNISLVADGSNADDMGDYRPGLQALHELGIISPLQEADMTKQDIRLLSKQMELPTWDKPAFACLASRIPYGHSITRQKMLMVDKAEQYLMGLGFRQCRVRHHGDIARIEVLPRERQDFMNERLMDQVNDYFKQIGFAYTALDLKGYRTGSLNETIDE